MSASYSLPVAERASGGQPKAGCTLRA